MGISVWDKVAVKFGENGPRYWDTFGNRLVELSNMVEGARVLDIGMGRGASLFPAAERVGKLGHVIGIDNSKAMVDETSKNIKIRNISNIEVSEMSGNELDFENNKFDNIICGFGIGYLLHYDEKLRGIINVLKPGGQIGFSIWAIQEDQRWLTEIVEKYLPPKPQAVPQNPNLPRFDNVDDVKKLLHNAGLRDVRVQKEDNIVAYKNENEWWSEMWTNAVRGILEQVQELGAEAYNKFEKEVSRGLKNFYVKEEIHFNMPVIYAFGTK